jgi:hypothetical protein
MRADNLRDGDEKVLIIGVAVPVVPPPGPITSARW